MKLIHKLFTVDDRVMRTDDFDYFLPEHLIAQTPAPRRQDSRLLVWPRLSNELKHSHFIDLPEWLREGDRLILNDSRVLPARLRGRNRATGGAFEFLLLQETAVNEWWSMVRPGRRAVPGTEIIMFDLNGAATAISATVLESNVEGHRRLRFDGTADIRMELEQMGEIPLPPYIHRPSPRAEDRERYQTVFAQKAGSVAAPTAGLHFTPEMLDQLRARGVKIGFVTLHVGAGTFAPVKAEAVADHVMHEEYYEVPEATAQLLQNRAEGRIIAVGTTTLRVLESVARAHDGKVVAGAGRTSIFIYPPYSFQVVTGLLTNFHLPRSTLLMLVSAFAAPGQCSGRETMLRTYAAAVEQNYRFFSYGDAMLII